MASLHVALFGAPQLDRDGEAVHISRRKTFALLAFLAVTGRPHRREALTALFWPEDDAATSRANLRRVLFELRQALGDEAVSTDHAAVRLNPQATVVVDVNAFKECIAAVHSHEHSSAARCPTCLAAMAQAAELYNGDFMAGFTLSDTPGFDEWQYFEAEKLRETFAECLQTIVAGRAQAEAYDEAIGYARRWLALDPLHEPAQRQLILLYALAGRKEAALRQYGECVRVLHEELGIEPEAETLALYQSIRSGRPREPSLAAETPEYVALPAGHATPGQPGPLHGFPLTTGRLIGRENELGRIKALLMPEEPCRVLTLTGPGGSGKTRLAIEAAALLGSEAAMGVYQDGIWFISLATIASARDVAVTIAQGVKLSILHDAQRMRQNLVQFLRQKQVLLVLDNFDEHIDEENLSLLLDILSAAPRAKLLVTSRARLNCQDEHVLAVTGLPTPPDNGREEVARDSERYDAVKMFCACATRLKPAFQLDQETLPHIVRICRLVDGMPLAIELAAAWIEVLSPSEIAAEIMRGLDFLEARWQGIPGRQRSLRAVFESSWELLDGSERQALMALTVFQSGFTRQAAEMVAGTDLKTLLALVHRSWLGHDVHGRYSIHELLCQYTNEKLTTDPVTHPQVMDRFCAYYAAFLEEQGKAMRGPGQREASVAIEQEFENIRIAWSWLVTHDAVKAAVDRLLPALYLLAEAHFRGIELRQMVALAVDTLQAGPAAQVDPRLLPVLLTARAAFMPIGKPLVNNVSGTQVSYERDDWPVLGAETEVLRRAWSLAGTNDELLEMGAWGIYLAYLYGRIVNLPAGVAALRFLAAGLRKQEQLWERGLALSSLGTLLDGASGESGVTRAMWDESKQHLLAALAVFGDLKDSRQAGVALRSLGRWASWRNRPQEAIQYWQSAAEALLHSGDRLMAATLNQLIGNVYLELCDYEAWMRCYDSCIDEYLQLGDFWMASAAMSWASLDLARHGDLKRARELREQSLGTRVESGREYIDPWHVWEMGELYRLEGNAPAARLWYDRARALFRDAPDQSWRAFYPRGLGDLAQMAGRFEDARGHFEESFSVAEATNHAWAASYALAGLGRAEIGLGSYESARDHLRLAFTRAKAIDNVHVLLVALSGLARLYFSLREHERSAALASLVVGHRATWDETRGQAAEILQALGIAIPDPVRLGLSGGGGAPELAAAAAAIEPDLARE